MSGTATPDSADRQLSDSEVQERGLRLSGCCCPDHGHTWYERTHDGNCWLECYHCADVPESGGGRCTCPSGDGSLRWPCPTHLPVTVVDRPDNGQDEHARWVTLPGDDRQHASGGNCPCQPVQHPSGAWDHQ